MPPGTSSLLERSTEVEELRTALERAAEGEGAVVLIEGEAGIGKTTLLRESRRIAGELGITPLTARASELEREYAFGIVRQLFQAPLARMADDERAQALSGAAALAGSLLEDAQDAPASSGGDTFALLHGLHWLCANLAL